MTRTIPIDELAGAGVIYFFVLWHLVVEGIGKEKEVGGAYESGFSFHVFCLRGNL